MDTVYQVWCEWDVGQDGCVFKSKETARKWVETNPNLLEMVENGDIESIEEVFSGGLASISSLKLI